MACYVDYTNVDVEKYQAIKDRHVPTGTEDVVWVHGLNCINTSTSPVEHFNGIVEMLSSGREICCGKNGEETRQNHPLGTIGLYVKGACSLMANWDCGSFVVDGKRYTSDESVVVDDYSDFGDPSNTMSYSEAFVAPEEIVGAWVNRKAYDEYQATTEETYWDPDLYEIEYLPKKEAFMEALAAIESSGLEIRFV